MNPGLSTRIEETAVGIGRLIDEGRLALSTEVKEIDNAYSGFIDESATILNLLTHTSGIYDYYDEEEITDFDNFTVEIPWFELETPSDYLPLFTNKDMKYKPASRYSYSNGGFVFLGMIIERITGRLYREFVEESVLQSAGMPDSGFFAFNDLPGNTAYGYLQDRKTNIYQLPIRGAGDGGMYTTVDDLCSFWQKLFSYELLSKTLTDEYLKTRWEFDVKTGYGCGIYKTLDDSVFYIVGGDGGVGFSSRFFTGDSTVVSVLSNTTNGEEKVVRCILQSINE